MGALVIFSGGDRHGATRSYKGTIVGLVVVLADLFPLCVSTLSFSEPNFTGTIKQRGNHH